MPGTKHVTSAGLVTVHAYVTSNGICRGFAFKYGKFLLPPRFLTALSFPKVPTREQLPRLFCQTAAHFPYRRRGASYLCCIRMH